MEQPADSIQVPLSSLIEIAIECWRLERWLADSQGDDSKATARHVTRRLSEVLKAHEITTMDMTGQLYEPGLAVEVVDTIADKDAPEGAGVIHETVAPVVAWRGVVVKHGIVVTRSRSEVKEQ